VSDENAPADKPQPALPSDKSDSVVGGLVYLATAHVIGGLLTVGLFWVYIPFAQFLYGIPMIFYFRRSKKAKIVAGIAIGFGLTVLLWGGLCAAILATPGFGTWDQNG
jgi:Na+/proline symporter